jgi:NAD(P)-dependent dehydrogenase (short-subunit alcohol dehydrogenase family)
MDLNGKVSLVAGGASGMGSETVRKLAASGANVVVGDVNDERGRALVEELPGDPLFVHLDVSAEDSWAEAVETISSEYGRLDTVHINAGLMTRPYNAPGFDDPLEWFTLKGYRRVESVNGTGVVLGVIHTLPLLEASGGTIIATSSTAGVKPLPWDPFYSMVKTGVIALVRSAGPLLKERGVRLMALCPEGIESEMAPPDLKAKRIAEGKAYAPGSWIAEAVREILDNGEPGDIWLARNGDSDFWVYPGSVPPEAGDSAAVAEIATKRIPAPKIA